MTLVDAARARLAAGELAEVRRMLIGATRAPRTEEAFEALMVLAEAERLSNTCLEAARTLAVARRVARELQRADMERRVGLQGMAVSLQGDVVSARELERLRELVSDPAEVAWLDAMEALSLARGGDREAAERLLARVSGVAALGGAAALQVLPWVAEAELALGRPHRAVAAARAGEWIAEGLGQLAHRDALARIARSAEGAGSPLARQAVMGLVDLASATAGARDLGPLFDQVGRAVMELLDVDRAFVVLRDDQGRRRVAASLGRKGEARGMPSRSIIDRALRTGLPVVSNDLDRDASARSASIVSMGLRSVICAPMLQGAEALGVIYGDSERVTEHELKRMAWLARGIAGVAGVAVANAQRLDAAERRSREGREIAHDVRNLVGSVLLSSEDIGEADDVPMWAREVAQQAQVAARRMQQHLDRLLSQRPPRRERVRLDALVDELITTLGRQARARRVAFRLLAEPVELAAAADELGRALTNLLFNALKYAPEGSEVLVRVEASGAVARVMVSDQGPGIPEGELEHIFTSGAQARGAVEGHGLGLGIARRVVQEHGGTIWAENRPEGGARFVVELALGAGGGVGSR